MFASIEAASSWQAKPPILVTRLIVVATGSNQRGPKGTPRETLCWAIESLQASQVRVRAASVVFETAPVGIGRQPPFLNLAMAVETSIPPARLLALFKRLERKAGRRFERGSGSRPLDLDIVFYRGRRIGRPTRRRERGSLIVPHPEAARRRFVLEPVAQFAPRLMLGRFASVRVLLTRLPRPPGEIRPTLDFLPTACK